MKTVLLAIGLLLYNSAFSQNIDLTKDFNNDAINDKLSITTDGGSAFSSRSINFKDGKTKKVYEYSVLCASGSFFTIGNLPNVLGPTGRGDVSKLLFHSRQALKPDPSLQWLIDAALNKTTKEGITDVYTRYNPIWKEGAPVIPDDYFIILKNNELLKHAAGSPEYDGTNYTSDYFCLFYFPQNHNGKRNTITVDTQIQLITMPHGVVMQKGNMYSWVFINDNQLFDANEKLRNPSVKEAQYLQGYVFIRQQVRGNYNLFMVNPDTGVVRRLNNETAGLSSIEKMEISPSQDGLLLSDGEGKTFIFTLKMIN